MATYLHNSEPVDTILSEKELLTRRINKILEISFDLYYGLKSYNIDDSSYAFIPYNKPHANAFQVNLNIFDSKNDWEIANYVISNLATPEELRCLSYFGNIIVAPKMLYKLKEPIPQNNENNMNLNQEIYEDEYEEENDDENDNDENDEES